MSTRKGYIVQSGYWFITFTCCNWLPLIEMTNSYDLIYNWFDHLTTEGHIITCYVIMPNHLHMLLAYKGGKPLNTLVANGKRFIAYEIIDRLQLSGKQEVLKTLRDKRSSAEIKAGKLHRVFEPSFDALHCYSLKVINQKLHYIHNNPCSKKWTLSPDPVSYQHSSAVFYETGKQSVYKVVNWMDLDEGNWMNWLNE